MLFKPKKIKWKVLCQTTSNSSVYKKAQKAYLLSQREIACHFCRYNRKDNAKSKTWFGGVTPFSINYPSWKKTNKVKKQWMKRKIQVIEIELINRVLFEVIY